MKQLLSPEMQRELVNGLLLEAEKLRASIEESIDDAMPMSNGILNHIESGVSESMPSTMDILEAIERGVKK